MSQWLPVNPRPERLPKEQYWVNLEVTGRHQMAAVRDGKDPKTVKPWIVVVSTQTGLDQVRKEKWELFTGNESQGMSNIFRPATAEEIAEYLADKELAIEARNKEVANQKLQNAGVVVMQSPAPETKQKADTKAK